MTTKNWRDEYPAVPNCILDDLDRAFDSPEREEACEHYLSLSPEQQKDIIALHTPVEGISAAEFIRQAVIEAVEGVPSAYTLRASQRIESLLDAMVRVAQRAEILLQPPKGLIDSLAQLGDESKLSLLMCELHNECAALGRAAKPYLNPLMEEEGIDLEDDTFRTGTIQVLILSAVLRRKDR